MEKIPEQENPRERLIRKNTMERLQTRFETMPVEEGCGLAPVVRGEQLLQTRALIRDHPIRT